MALQDHIKKLKEFRFVTSTKAFFTMSWERRFREKFRDPLVSTLEEITADIPTVPTKLSELDNDTGFITTSDIPPIPENTSDLNNDSGFITINDIPAIPENTSDLNNDSGFITINDVPATPTNLSDFTNDVGFITGEDVPQNVSELNNDAGYITEDDLPDDLDINSLTEKTNPDNTDVFLIQQVDGTFMKISFETLSSFLNPE